MVFYMEEVLGWNEYDITVLYISFHFPPKFSEDIINSVALALWKASD